MRFLILGLACILFCYPSVRCGSGPQPDNPFDDDTLHRTGNTGYTGEDLKRCMPCVHYASGMRPVVSADFHYGFGGLLAAATDLYPDYIDMADAAMTLPITRLALSSTR